MPLIDSEEFRRRALQVYPEYWEDVLDEMEPADAVSLVRSAPTVEVPDMNVVKWIDTREALPEYFQTVLVTVDGFVCTGELNHYMVDGTKDWTISDDFCVRFERVTAWAPLPEPYERKDGHADA